MKQFIFILLLLPLVAANCSELIESIEKNEDIILAKDLNCKLNEWYPKYSKTLNGNGHTLEIEIVNEQNKPTGLFSKLTGKVENLILNIKINGISHIGSIAGIGENAEIKNVTINSEIEGHSIIGGILGVSNNTLITQARTDSKINGVREVGGAIGVQFSGVLKTSTITSEIQANDGIGSLVGVAFDSIEDTKYNSNINDLIGINRNAKITKNEYKLINNNRKKSFYKDSNIEFDYSFFVNNIANDQADCNLIIPELDINELMREKHRVTKQISTTGTFEYTINCNYNDHMEAVTSNFTVFEVIKNPKIISDQDYIKLINSFNPKEYSSLALSTLNTKLEYFGKVNVENLDLNLIEIEDNYVSIPDESIHESLRKSTNNQPIAKITFEKTNCNNFALRYVKDDSKYEINRRSGEIVAESIDLTNGQGVCNDQSICRNYECKDQKLSVEIMHFSKFILEDRPNTMQRLIENKMPLYLIIFAASLIFLLRRN